MYYEEGMLNEMLTFTCLYVLWNYYCQLLCHYLKYYVRSILRIHRKGNRKNRTRIIFQHMLHEGQATCKR